MAKKKSKPKAKKSNKKGTKKVSKPILKEIYEEEKKPIGHLAFLAGVIVALIAGLSLDILDESVVTLVLLVLGVIVGFLNVTIKEEKEFLLASLALMLAGIANVIVIPFVGIYLNAMLENIGTFVAPAAIVVALKTVWRLAKET